MLNCPTCGNDLRVDINEISEEYGHNRKIYSLECPIGCYVPCMTSNKPNRNIILELYRQLYEPPESFDSPLFDSVD